MDHPTEVKRQVDHTTDSQEQELWAAKMTLFTGSLLGKQVTQ